jgi:1-acyl-sn-glycerol-3-phosphate acyltransferase
MAKAGPDRCAAPHRLTQVLAVNRSLGRLIAHFAAGLWISAVVFPFVDKNGRERHIKRWSQRLVDLCGVQVRLLNPEAVVTKPGMLVSNHISWLDIFVINSLQPCCFVAKSEIRSWPLMGWLCYKAGTIFIARGRQREVRKTFEGLVESLRSGEIVAFFPEGTTVAQGSLAPFHANLFEAAIQSEAPVLPCALRYVDSAGNLHPAIDYVGDMTLMQSIRAILNARGMTAELTVLPAIRSVATHRRSLSQSARTAIAAALGQVEATSQASAAAGNQPELRVDPSAGRQ